MKSQNLTIGADNSKIISTYKNAIDLFGGPMRLAEKLNIALSTIYKWMSGSTMSINYAIRINAAKPEILIKDLIGYELDCHPIYLSVVNHFGNQTKTAKALNLSQFTVHTWIMGTGLISLEKATLLEEVTKGLFNPSDFPHLCSEELEA